MNRPSSLQLSELCGLAPALGAKFPETSPAAASGIEKHSEIAALINGIKLPKVSPEAEWAVEWLRGIDGSTGAKAEVFVELRDPDSETVITSGTLDAAVSMSDGVPLIVDWKGGDPMNVPDVFDSLQLASYSIAYGLLTDAPAVSWQYVFLRDRRASDRFTLAQADWWPWIERIKAAATREPIATPGVWCGGCFQKHHCDAWRDRAATALRVLGENTEVALNDDVAAVLALRRDAAAKALDIVDEVLKTYVRSGGKVQAGGKAWSPSQRAGRSTVDVDALKAQGIEIPMKTGKPYEVWSWAKVRA